MILLDTNVISELMRAKPEAVVIEWFGLQEAAAIHTTAITAAEIGQGLALLPPGKRRERLQHAARQLFEQLFRGKVHPFDLRSAMHFGPIVALRRALARPISFGDAAIAAIAMEHQAAIATRDVEGFSDLGVTVINPWGK